MKQQHYLVTIQWDKYTGTCMFSSLDHHAVIVDGNPSQHSWKNNYWPLVKFYVICSWDTNAKFRYASDIHCCVDDGESLMMNDFAFVAICSGIFLNLPSTVSMCTLIGAESCPIYMKMYPLLLNIYSLKWSSRVLQVDITFHSHIVLQIEYQTERQLNKTAKPTLKPDQFLKAYCLTLELRSKRKAD